jgi:hypothetical protein
MSLDAFDFCFRLAIALLALILLYLRFVVPSPSSVPVIPLYSLLSFIYSAVYCHFTFHA